MRTMSSVMNSTIVFSVLMMSPTRFFAQAYQPGTNEVSRKITAGCGVTPCLLDGALVVGAPFSAEATTVWHPPAGSGRAEMQATAHYYRDSVGRVRVEQGFVGHDQRLQRIILTLDARTAYLLDPVARTTSVLGPRGVVELIFGFGGYSEFVLPLSMNRSIGFLPVQPPDSASAVSGELLGERTIAGVLATGTRFVTQLPVGVIGVGRVERWVSPDLKLVVHSRSEDAAIGIVEYQLTKITRSDPRAELFEVPEDYVVTQLKFPFFVENPYTPKTSLTR
jgi:hypothetical protein